MCAAPDRLRSARATGRRPSPRCRWPAPPSRPDSTPTGSQSRSEPFSTRWLVSGAPKPYTGLSAALRARPPRAWSPHSEPSSPPCTVRARTGHPVHHGHPNHRTTDSHHHAASRCLQGALIGVSIFPSSRGVRSAGQRGEEGSRGWSQAQLADVLGLDASGVSRLEAGRKKVGLAEAVRIASALGVSLDHLIAPTAPDAELERAVMSADDAVVAAREAMVKVLHAAERTYTAGRSASPEAVQAALDVKDVGEIPAALVGRVNQTAAGSGVMFAGGVPELEEHITSLTWAVSERIAPETS
ncbi:helix-turn-helix transcriptional regulator [Mycolicibacterium thermoresistibile]